MAVLGCNDRTMTDDKLEEIEQLAKREGFSSNCAKRVR